MPAGTRRLLIADDSNVIRSRLEDLVSDQRGTTIVGIAVNSEQALQLFRSTGPDLVILDLRMPDGSGFHVLEEIKKISPRTQVAILTNYPYAAYRKRCAELGADFFFDKSTEFEKVKTLL